MDYAKESLRLYGEWKGKIEVITKVPVATKEDLTLAYTPGVAQPSLIFPEEAKAGGACVIATGRSDFPNQINNVLAFLGIFRGTFDVRAKDINQEMKMAAIRIGVARL